MALTSEALDKYRRILNARRDELAAGASRAESDVSDQNELGESDPSDRGTADTAKDDLLQEAGRDTDQIVAIEDALRRIDDGTYGVCTACGKPIPEARLNAVPWAAFCIADQQIADERTREAAGLPALQGGEPSRVA